MKKLVWVIILYVGYSYCSENTFKLGLENISDNFAKWLSKHRVGLITNQTGHDQAGNKTVDVLAQKGVAVRVLFAPEHGSNGTISPEEEVKDIIDPATNIPVVSLYGKWTGKKITAHKLKDIDVLIFDIQDSGMRHYTYISTLLHAMKAAARHGKYFVVLDRPNPLGWRMEGPLVENSLRSFISVASIPVRHGMTVGELAWYYNTHELKNAAKLYVVRMQHYTRTMHLPKTLETRLSPNITNRDSCYGYSFLGLLSEVRPFDTGVGTANAFQCVLLQDDKNLPDNAWFALHKQLAKLGVTSKPYRYFSMRKKRYYRGLKLNIEDINAVSSFKVLMAMLRFFKNQGIKLEFSPVFNKAAGTHAIQQVLNGSISEQQFMKKINQGLHTFFEQAKIAFMYQPLPRVAEIR